MVSRQQGKARQSKDRGYGRQSRECRPVPGRIIAPHSSTEHLLVYNILAVRLAVEDREHVLYCDNGHPHPRLLRYPGHMRGTDEIIECQERVVGRGRLLVEDVERGTGDLAADERVM